MNDYYFTERGIFYRMSEKKTRQTILLLHGLSGSSSAWRHYEESLSDSFHLVIPDLRGHGFSKRYKSKSAYAINDYADDIELLLAYIEAKDVMIVAHSFSALIVRELVKRKINCISRVLLLAPAYRVNQLFLTRLFSPLVTLVSYALYLLPVRASGTHVDFDRFPRSTDWSPRRIYADVRSTSIHSYLWSLDTLYRYSDDRWDEFKRIPTGIVQGCKDRFVPVAHGIALAKSIDSPFQEFPKDSNHMLVINDVELVSSTIKRFAQSN